MSNKRNGLPFNGLLTVMFVLIGLAIVVHIAGQLSLHRGAPSGPVAIDLANRLSLDSEMSVPTWLAALFGIIMGIIGLAIAKAQAVFSKRLAWYLLAAMAFFISIDEVSALHELLLQGLHMNAGFGEVQTLWSNAWLLILPFVAAILLVLLTYWYHSMPRKTFFRLFAGIVVYLLGALVVEYAAIQVDKGVRIYTIGYVVVEESLEYFGLWLMIRASMAHIAQYEPDLKNTLLRLTKPR